MTVAKSGLITNLDATPPIYADQRIHSGAVKVSVAQVALATTDIDDNDIIHMVRLPSDAVVHSIMLANDDLDAGATPTLVFDLGTYYGSGGSEGTVIDRDILGTVITQLQAAAALTELRYEVANITTCEQPLWQLSGLSSDPGGLIDISLTIETVAQTAAAGDVIMRVLWS